MICLRCEVVEVGVGLGHVASCGRGLRPSVHGLFQMGGDFGPSACGGDAVVWGGCADRKPHARCRVGSGHASPRVVGLATTQREWRPAQGFRGTRHGCARLDWGRPMARVGTGRSVGFGGGPVQSCGGRVGDLHRGGGVEHARGPPGSMDVVRLVAASQPSWIVGMSGVDVVSGRTVGHSVESRPDVVGRPAPVASLESRIASVGWRSEVGGRGGLVLVPSSQHTLVRGGNNPVHRAIGSRESEAAWVACGPRTAWCCRVSSLGLAMGGMTLNDWTKAVVVMGLQATSFSAGVAQMGHSEWSWDVPVDVWRTLSREAARGHCSWASAEAVARHVELHGKPWAAESARRIEGLDTATQRWLEGQPWWRQWAMDQVANAAQGSSASQHSWAIERSWSAHALAPTGLGIWRGKTSQAKWTCTTDHPTTWAGSLWGRRGDLRWTLGDHSAGWGQGLTIPRGRAFGTEWHVGDPGLPAPGRLVPSMQTGHHGLMRGLAGEWFRGDRTFGASIGPRHVAALSRLQRGPDEWLDVEGWMSRESRKMGASGAIVVGPHHFQGAVAMVWPDQTVLGHASVRRAWGDTWLLQATGRVRWAFHEPEASHLTTLCSMACRPRKGGVPFQVRLSVDNRKGTLEARVHPKRGWRLAFTSREGEGEWGVRHHRKWGQIEVAVRHSVGRWAMARQVKMTHKLEGPRRARLGMLWMEGAQGGATQRAVLPWAGRMTWMQTPAEGARASLWAAWNDREGNRTWSVHAAWAPSQQVAFRCALRLSWEA